jgi:hypothetical protein
MSVISEIRASLDAIGYEQQACVFMFLMSYPLAIGGLLESRGRRTAGLTAGASAIAFGLLTDPWMHAVLLVVLGVGGLGVFIGAVTLADDVSRRVALRGMPKPGPEPVLDVAAVQPAPGRERVRIGATASVKP